MSKALHLPFLQCNLQIASNLVFQYRPVLALDMDGAVIEEFGIAPDVLLPTRAKNSNDKVSPLAACRDYIEHLEKKDKP